MKRHLRKTVLIFNKNLVSENSKDPKKLHSIANKLLGNKQKAKFPESSSTKHLADSFMNFFLNKVKLIRGKLPVQNSLPVMTNTKSVPQLSFFQLAPQTEFLTIITRATL